MRGWWEPARRVPPATDAWKKTPAKKDTRKWCKGKVGVEHVLDIRLTSHAEAYNRTCGWSTSFRLLTGRPDYYICFHERFCVNCGKIVAHTWEKKRECPLWTEPPIVG